VVLLQEAHLDRVLLALKEVEDEGQLSGIDPNACVLNHEFKPLFSSFSWLVKGDLDNDLSFKSELHCVHEQVKQDLLESLFVGFPGSRQLGTFES